MQIASRVFGIAAWVIVGAGCAQGDFESGGGVATTEQALWSSNGTQYWPNATIPVCFQPRINRSTGLDELGTPNYVLQTTRIQSVIESVFETIPGAHLDFTGWQTCPGPSVPQNGSDGLPFGGGLKIMIQCDAPGVPARGGWQTHAGYQGPDNHARMWTSQSLYTWGTEWDGALEHETLHGLGFQHEYDRDDIERHCATDGAGEDPESAGTRWTVYDSYSATNETYCGDNQAGLSDLDRLGLSMVYPDGSPIRIRSFSGLRVADGLVVRSDDTLTSDWTWRGAYATRFVSLPAWDWLPDGQQQPTALGESLTLAASALGAGRGTLSGDFVADVPIQPDKQLEPTVIRVDNGLHAALVVSTL